MHFAVVWQLLHPLQKFMWKSSIQTPVTSYFFFKHSETMCTISAVAPFRTGLQFMTNAFI